MDAMIPLIYLAFFILTGPALAIVGTWMWRKHQEDKRKNILRKIAEEKLLRIPKRMPGQEQRAS